MAGARTRPAMAADRIPPVTAIPRATATDHINLVTVTRPATDIPPVTATDRTTPTTARRLMTPRTGIRPKSQRRRICSHGAKRSLRSPNHPSNS